MNDAGQVGGQGGLAGTVRAEDRHDEPGCSSIPRAPAPGVGSGGLQPEPEPPVVRRVVRGEQPAAGRVRSDLGEPDRRQHGANGGPGPAGDGERGLRGLGLIGCRLPGRQQSCAAKAGDGIGQGRGRWVTGGIHRDNLLDDARQRSVARRCADRAVPGFTRFGGCATVRQRL